MSRTGTFLSALLFISLALSCKDTPKGDAILNVHTFFGDVKIVNAGGENAARVGTALKAGDAIITGDSSVADLLYGAAGIIRINEKTSISVTQLVSPDTKGDTDLSIDRGKMFVTVSKLAKGSSFKVKSPTAIAAVRGTTFKVTTGESSSRIDVLAGKVKVNPVKEGKVIEEAEKIVEVNNTVTLDVKAVEKIIERKQEIEVAVLKTEEIKEIREEIKSMKPVQNLSPELEREIEQVAVEKPEEEAVKDDSAEKREENKRREALERQRAWAEKQRIERERLEKERLEKERIAREKQEQKEKRVKNIPTL